MSLVVLHQGFPSERPLLQIRRCR